MAMPYFLMLNLRICVYVSTTFRTNSREEDIWLVLSFLLFSWGFWLLDICAVHLVGYEEGANTKAACCCVILEPPACNGTCGAIPGMVLLGWCCQPARPMMLVVYLKAAYCDCITGYPGAVLIMCN
jgi:hypothetical protein